MEWHFAIADCRFGVDFCYLVSDVGGARLWCWQLRTECGSEGNEANDGRERFHGDTIAEDAIL